LRFNYADVEAVSFEVCKAALLERRKRVKGPFRVNAAVFVKKTALNVSYFHFLTPSRCPALLLLHQVEKLGFQPVYFGFKRFPFRPLRLQLLAAIVPDGLRRAPTLAVGLVQLPRLVKSGSCLVALGFGLLAALALFLAVGGVPHHRATVQIAGAEIRVMDKPVSNCSPRYFVIDLLDL
jgi:hypothetical protein